MLNERVSAARRLVNHLHPLPIAIVPLPRHG